ncbi:MAG: hypothetical protein LBP98_02150 [Tannerella sp.]|jgi:hypothetical protein|nr:hypothetical protein [Tannerella sp.]
MENLFELLISQAGTISGHVNQIFGPFAGDAAAYWCGGGLTLAAALGATAQGRNLSDGLLAYVRRWHGSIDYQFANIDNLVNTVTAHQQTWAMPTELYNLLTTSRNQLQTLINLCRTGDGSHNDRDHRNALLKSTVGLCLLRAKLWAYGQYEAGVLTEEDVHRLGFLLPGETAGHRGRTEATDVIAEVKVTVVNEDYIRVVIDQASGENAALVSHGWPPGVKMALIVITASDGVTEVLRIQTTHLHNDIEMPEGSHGKQFIIKAAFLKHVTDKPRFGNEPTFSMPLTTADLVAALDRQHHEEFEAHLRETERHRQEIERLRAQLQAQSK